MNDLFHTIWQLRKQIATHLNRRLFPRGLKTRTSLHLHLPPPAPPPVPLPDGKAPWFVLGGPKPVTKIVVLPQPSGPDVYI